MSLKKVIKYLFLLIATCLLQFNSLGQDKIIDSLKIALKNAKHDTTRCNILSVLAETASDKEWPAFNEQLKSITKKNLLNQVEFKNIYLKHLSSALINEGYLAQLNGNNNLALSCYQKSLKYQEAITDKKGSAISLNCIGLVYYNLGNIQEALYYYLKSLKIRESIGDKKGESESLTNLGSLFNNLGDTQKSLDYYNKSLKLRRELGDKRDISETLNNLGVIYTNINNPNKALIYQLESLKMRQEIEDKWAIGYSLDNIGVVYYNLNNVPKALDCIKKAVEIRKEINDKQGLSKSYSNLAAFYLLQNNLIEGSKYGNLSLKISNEIGFPEEINNAAHQLKKIYVRQGKYQEAFQMYEVEIKMRDSIRSEENQKAAMKKQLQYTYDKKEAVAKKEHEKKLEKQKAIDDEKQRKQNIVIWSVVVGLVLVIGFAGYVFKTLRITRKQKSLIETKSKEVEEKQTEILDSIHYAKRIQTAQLPSDKYIIKNLNRLKNKG